MITDPTLYILRGLPGSGKSTYARNRWPGLTPAHHAPKGWSPLSISGDHFFTSLEGEYTFDPSKLGQAHANAQVNLLHALKAGTQEVIVDNSHSRLWEFQMAIELGKAFGYQVKVISLFDNGCTDEELTARNVHEVPPEVIASHRSRWEPCKFETSA